MRKLKLYIAVSLNGKIARKDGAVDWLDSIPNPDSTDYGYHQFYASVDTTIQGNNTYKQVMGMDIDFPYADKENFVLTRNQSEKDNEYASFVSEDPIAFIKKLKQEKGKKDIWLIGGGQVNTLLFNHGLIDEIELFVMPITIPDGIDLFEGEPIEKHLKMTDVRHYESGVVKINYTLD